MLVMDIVDRLFVTMFDSLEENCQKELEAIGKQYPFEPLKYLRKTLRLTFQEGVQMLKENDLYGWRNFSSIVDGLLRCGRKGAKNNSIEGVPLYSDKSAVIEKSKEFSVLVGGRML
ncbi:unnamed protein product [Ilex paraguariensis]|uniref:Uncharacterized protein n=1 Tax=Ilex paraguariensis TaxID=185542 RepID=A0ABC8TLT2_9AQUA